MNQQNGYYGLDVGDVIKAYDFQPCPDRDERFVIGRISEAHPQGTAHNRFAHYVVDVTVDRTWPENPRDRVLVPMHMSFDYEGRVRKLDVRDTLDAGRLVRLGRKVLHELERAPGVVELVDELIRFARGEGLLEQTHEVRVAIAPDRAWSCANCGEVGELVELLADNRGDYRCPECGSVEVERVEVTELAREAS